MAEVIKFSNPGSLDPRLWSTFGVSVKEGDDSIGQFGTGLKYAIAVLMRYGRALRIETGGMEYNFGVVDAEFRGSAFHQITCNDAPLPFTTHLGSKWELWQAYREIYSNCLDEGGEIDGDFDTAIYAEIGDVRHDDVFLDRNRSPVTTSRTCDVYSGDSRYVFYKGIRALELPRPAKYTYNILSAELTEDRTFKYNWQVQEKIGDAVMQSTNRDFVWDFLLATKDWWEEKIDFDWTDALPTDCVRELVNQYRKDNVYMQKGMVSRVSKHLGASQYLEKEMDERQQRIVEKASKFCKDIGYEIKYPVKLSDDLGAGNLGMAEERTKTIYLSEMVMTQGVKQVAATLIEENIHLAYGLSDCTYPMQSFLFDQIVTMGEKLTGDIL